MESLADLPMGVRGSAFGTRVRGKPVCDVGLGVGGLLPSLLRGVADFEELGLDTALGDRVQGGAGVLLAGLVTGDDVGFSTNEATRSWGGERRGLIQRCQRSECELVARHSGDDGKCQDCTHHRRLWQLVMIISVWACAFIFWRPAALGSSSDRRHSFASRSASARII